MRYSLSILFFTAFIATVIFSCRKDDAFFETSGKLSFSTDTVMFDTVFTTVGSATRHLKVYNPHNRTIKISSIVLAGGSQSVFKVNIDGRPAHEIKDLELAPKDSLYIFLRATVDPNNKNTPFVVNDSIIFITNDHMQQVKLVAWGQNAHYHTPEYFPAHMSPYSLIDNNTTWTSDRPHLVYGWVVVDSSYTLTIEEGAQIHFHNNSGIWVYSGGTLKVRGSVNAPVVFQGDRLESWYKDMPGQWGRLLFNGNLFSMGIWLSSGSIDNEIDYAIIRNGDTGVKVDTIGASANPTLRISNTIIENMSTAGLHAQGSHVEGENLVITNIGMHALILSIGGNYSFKHSTIANYWSYASRQTPSLVLNNYYIDVNDNLQLRPLTRADFGNSIIYGAVEEEVFFDGHAGADFNFFFDHCLLRTLEDISDGPFFNNSLKNKDPLFEDVSEGLYKLRESSPARKAGSLTIAAQVPFDINGVARTTSPDLGAYQSE